jgi:glutamate-ammonia-ligase adenylyltransferase
MTDDGLNQAWRDAQLPAGTGRARDIGRERWAEGLDKADLPEADREALAAFDATGALDCLFAFSPYLTQLALGNMDFLATLARQGPDAARQAALDGLGDPREAKDEAAISRILRRAKQRIALTVALADIGGIWPLEAVTGALSQFADRSVKAALTFLLAREQAAGRMAFATDTVDAAQSGIVILGMGKLGAGELNYSSDIDLIVLYDPDLVPIAKPDRLQRDLVRLTRDLVRIMEARTGEGYVFRTDLRLRPDPGATPLAVTVTAALNYYEALAQNWERAAMIKARPMAGDPRLGRTFLEQIRPFVWRQSLDFAALEDIHLLRRRHAKHAHKPIELPGHDIKIGRGGIREIEFFVQTQQLLFGGRDARLRPRATLDALECLVEAGHIDAESGHRLAERYRFLRTVEHRLQMVDDQQTQRLPSDADALAALAGFLGYADADGFQKALGEALHDVEATYADLFGWAESEEAAERELTLSFAGVDPIPETEEQLAEMGFEAPGDMVETVRGWLRGRYRATRAERSRRLLTAMIPDLLTALARSGHPDRAFTRFDRFLSGLPAGIQLFALFRANPSLIGLLAEILGTAERLAQEMTRRPDHLDAVLSPGFFDRLPHAGQLHQDLEAALAGHRYFEDEMVALRRWAADHRFRADVHLLRGITHGDRLAPFLSDVADTALQAILPRVEREFAVRHGTIPGGGLTILALGKLGSREMGSRSDLDLIIVYDAPDGAQSDGDKPLEATTYYTRLTQRLISAITAPMAEEALYEVDMRLRPSGKAGPVATSLAAFRRYHQESAWTWERLALTRARTVAGPVDLRAKVDHAVRDVLTADWDREAMWRDVAAMRERMAKHHKADSPWAVKHARGGLVDIEFIAQSHLLAVARDHAEILTTNTAAILSRLAEIEAMEADTAHRLIDVLQRCHRIQAYARLTADGDPDPAALPPAVAAGLVQASDPDHADQDLDDAQARLREALGAAHRLYQRLVEEPARAAGWTAEAEGAEETD